MCKNSKNTKNSENSKNSKNSTITIVGNISRFYGTPSWTTKGFGLCPFPMHLSTLLSDASPALPQARTGCQQTLRVPPSRILHQWRSCSSATQGQVGTTAVLNQKQGWVINETPIHAAVVSLVPYSWNSTEPVATYHNKNCSFHHQHWVLVKDLTTGGSVAENLSGSHSLHVKCCHYARHRL